MNSAWPPRPVIYEINTLVWLHELSIQYQRPVTLDNVAAEQWDALAALNIDAVWLMGVWERSPESKRIAEQNADLQADFHRTLPDYTPADNVGSAYSIRSYVVNAQLGGFEGLASARQMLVERGMRLILDFVPNHVARDHPWIFEHPEYFVQGTQQDLLQAPGAFFKIGSTVFACGRDPYSAPWTDVAQLNAFNPRLRQEAIETICSIAQHCDGIRCDMAMLLLNNVFERTWEGRAGKRPEEEYWRAVISAVRSHYPNLLLLAETYWDLEWDLQQLGFDYCYDKRFYDKLMHGNAESVRQHLTASLDYQDKLLRFIENHDEPRAAAILSREQAYAAVVTLMTLPGAKLLYEGQLAGRQVRPSVFLARRLAEPGDTEQSTFYHWLLAAIKATGMSEGQWQLCPCTGWPDNGSYKNVIAWSWSNNQTHYLVAVNLSQDQSQARVHLPWHELSGKMWQLVDVLNNAQFARDGNELQLEGLYVDLPAWKFHFLHFQPQHETAS